MEPSYHILYKEGQGEVVEKKSRFIANIFPVNTEEEALERIGQIKKKHYDARHNCFAYVIGEKNEIMRCSDDGEPAGTAGRPMLEVLTGSPQCCGDRYPVFWRDAVRNRWTGAGLYRSRAGRAGALRGAGLFPRI